MTLTSLANQIILMFLLMLVGFIIHKVGFMHEQTSNDLTNILLSVVGPCLIIKAFNQSFSQQHFHELLVVGGGVLLVYFWQAVIVHILFHKVQDLNLRAIVEYSSVYPNVGFLGIPLTAAIFGTQGVFFAVVSLAVFNIFNWSHGVTLFRTKGAQMSLSQTLRQILINPNIIAIVIGLVIFITPIQLPKLLWQGVDYISAANTPMAMIIVGSSLASLRLDRSALNLPILTGLLLRNILFPILACFGLRLLGISGLALSVSVLLAACPVASIGVLFTLQAHRDASPAVSLMSLSTISSLVTIPFVFLLIGL